MLACYPDIRYGCKLCFFAGSGLEYLVHLMFFKKKKKATFPDSSHRTMDRQPGLIQSILLGYGIVVLHISLIAMVGLVVLVLSGIVNYFIWLLLFGVALVGGGIWYFLRKMKDEQQAIRRILGLPEFQNKTVEISLFGGAASLKVGSRAEDVVDVKSIGASSTPLLDLPGRSRLDDLGELSRLYDNGMITREEFEQLKIELLSQAVGRENHSA